MERNPDQTSIPMNEYSRSVSEQQPASGCSTDRKEDCYQSDGHLPSQPFTQEQQQQPDNSPPRWLRTLVRLILESSAA